jgi:hypothetical protein
MMKDVPHVRVNAHITPLGFYLLGYHSKDMPIVVDDVDSILDNKDVVALLKQFAETVDIKKINWISTTKLLGDVPNSYETKSRILIICNDLNVLSKKVGALLDRGWVIEFQPTVEELLRKMEEIKDYISNGLADEEKQEVLDLVNKFAVFGNVTLRTFVKGMQLLKECNGNDGWEEKLSNEMELNPKLILIDNLLQRFESDKERLLHWIGSRSSYYEMKRCLVQKSSLITNMCAYPRM